MSKRSSNHSDLLHIATLGRTVGLGGDVKLHIKTDFPEQFVPNATFTTDKKQTIRLIDVNDQRGTVRIEGFQSLESAKRLTNARLYTTQEATREQCVLDEDEFFWFDVIGCKVYESGQCLGVVQEIERISIHDYLSVRTDDALVAQGESKDFLIPYHEPFLVNTDIVQKRIDVEGALDILQAS